MQLKINHHSFKSISSTNTWALQNLNTFDTQALTVITAKEQSSGRGRQNRTWSSPGDTNLYATYCLFVDSNDSIKSICNIPQILAISCAETLSDLALNVQLKWPNDILVDEKKVAGILCETKRIDNKIFVATGIGLNINMTDTILHTLDKPATSILAETGVTHPIESIELLLREKFIENIQLFFKSGFSTFHKKFNARLYHPPEVRFHDNRSVVTGKILQLNSDGTLEFQESGGRIRTLHYGELESIKEST
ncbi:MAG: biotin--[acetyl-CoA-carboxylase] ligase [Chlamydiota bacterium]|nr:biotin--[acetyl-CoA-carboxylase] ligase [Chlamydiota bacterium]